MDRTIYRLHDIADAIAQIDILLENKTFAGLQSDRILRAAFERFLEIISEASRHVPQQLTGGKPQIPWKRIHSIGNHLRHAYNKVDAEVPWRPMPMANSQA